MRIAAAETIDELQRRITACQIACDPVATHGLRVASRRLDVWLRLGDLQILGDDLRWLRGIAGPVRDLDVRIAAGADADGLVPVRDRARAQLVGALSTPRAAGLLVALRVLPPIARSTAREQRKRLARRALRLPDGDAEALHVVRRAVRRVRYALEWLGEDDGPLPKVQDALGEVSDLLAADRTDPQVEATAREAWRDARPFLKR